MIVKIFALFLTFAFTNFVKSHEVDYFETIEIFQTNKILKSIQDTDDVSECKQALSEYWNGLKKQEMWAVTMFDSSAKVPDGLFAGNLKFLGHFDECVGVEHPNGTFKGQHCMLDVNINIPAQSSSVLTGRPLQPVATAKSMNLALSYAICVPSICTPSEIVFGMKNFFNQSKISSDLINVSLIEDNCRVKEPIPLTDVDWAVVGILIAFGVIALCSTIYDVFARFYQEKEKPHPILTSFSVYSNGKQLFHISEASSQLKCLHGLRFFSMCWVVLGHSFSSTAFGAIENLFDMSKMMKDVNHTVIVNGYLSVDTFFFLSGILVCFVFFRDISKKKYYDVPVAYIHRYIRLTPPFGMMMLIQATIFVYMGNGPLWGVVSKVAIDPCRENWWSGLLYVQNFATPDSQCLGQSWYLTTDMQLYWLSPLVLYPILFFPLAAPIYLLLLILVVAFTNFAVAYVEELGPSAIFTTNPDQMKIEYIQFYTRAVPWLVGVGVAYLICGIQAKKIEIKLTKFWILIGWLTSAGLCLGALYGIVPFTDIEYTILEAAFYLSFHRVAWSLGLAWIVFACIQGYGGIVNTFLSWNVFQPLGKLSYCTFLIHSFLLFIRVGNSKTNFHVGDLELTYAYLADVVIAYLAAIPFTLLFEMPFGNIDRYLFQNVKILPFPRPKKTTETRGNVAEGNRTNLEKVVAQEQEGRSFDSMTDNINLEKVITEAQKASSEPAEDKL